MRTIFQNDSTPQKDGFRMPAEFEPHAGTLMLWPERADVWRQGGEPARCCFEQVARAIAQFEPVTVCASPRQYAAAAYRFEGEQNIRVLEIESDDAWMRDIGPTFVTNAAGCLRAVDWDFNAWGGLFDGLYFPWDKDALVAQKVCAAANVTRYKPHRFVLEGGSIHVDGQGTVLTTESCLLSPGRNPHLNREQVEQYLCGYLGASKVLWLKEGIDPDETDGHIDDVACFVAPGKVAVIQTDDPQNPFYRIAKELREALSGFTDARGRSLEILPLCLPETPLHMAREEAQGIEPAEGCHPRREGELLIASYMNFLIVNGGVIVPQYGDKNDELALAQLAQMFPGRRVVGVPTREVVLGGGNIHCITQQVPAGQPG